MAGNLRTLPSNSPPSLPETMIQRWPRERTLREDLGWWKVAWLKPRHEKAFADDLRDLGLPYYLPFQELRHRRPDNGKVRMARVPLFPAYVSFAGEGPTAPLYRTGRLLRILSITDQERFVADLEAVQRVLMAGRCLEAHPGLHPGARVRIVRGPMQGLRGPIERVGGKWRFWVNVELFQRSVSVEVSPEMLMAEA